MSGPNTISADKLNRLMGTPTAPNLIEVRTAEDFSADPRLLPCSIRANHTDEARLLAIGATGPSVIICQRGAKLSHGTAALLHQSGHESLVLTGGFEAWRDAGLPLIPERIIPVRTGNGRTRWVTRHRPKIDRIACPWLIRRFVDQNAEFLFVEPDQVEGVASRFGATPFDVGDGFWSHRGDTCTFDTMLKEFALETAPLLQMATIIRAADTARLDDSKEAAGLLAISLGLSRQYSVDHEQLAAGLAIYDALYRWCRDAMEETHNWPSATKPSS